MTVVLGTLLTLSIEGVIEHSKIVGMCLCMYSEYLITYFALDKYRRISSAYVTVTPEVKEIIKISDSVIKVYMICEHLINVDQMFTYHIYLIIRIMYSWYL